MGEFLFDILFFLHELESWLIKPVYGMVGVEDVEEGRAVGRDEKELHADKSLEAEQCPWLRWSHKPSYDQTA